MSSLDPFVASAKALGDPLRADILRVLERDSFGVLELARIMDIPQPALSHHLKLLSASGLVTTRRDGTSIYYRRAPALGDSPLARFTVAAFDVLDATPLPAAVRGRVRQVHAERAARSRAFFEIHSAEFRDQQALICAPEVYLPAVEELVLAAGCPRRAALDVGPGDGQALAMLARHFERVVGIDNSASMLARAREATQRLDNVSLRLAELDTVRGRFDLVLMSMVVHHAPSPPSLFHEAARVLAARSGRIAAASSGKIAGARSAYLTTPGGLLVLVELCTHRQTWTKDACGDLWLGFEPEELDAWAGEAGFSPAERQYLAQRNGFRIQIRLYRSNLEENHREAVRLQGEGPEPRRLRSS